MPPIPRETSTLLIVAPSWVGDTVMATPVLRAIRHHAADARIVCVARPGLAALLAGCPWIDEIVTASLRGLLGPWSVARRLRAFRADAALVLPNSFRSALTVRLAGPRRRVGRARDGRSMLLTHRLPPARSALPTSTVDDYAHLGAWACGLEAIDTRPELFVTATEADAAERALGDIATDAPLVVLVPGGNRAAKRWPAERFAQVADALRTSHGAVVAVTGSPSERETLDAVLEAATAPMVDLSARGIDLGSLKGVLRRAALAVTNDTGPRHVAAALGTPTVALFGPTDHRWTTLPVDSERLLVAEPFLPEHIVADRVPKTCAIERIPVSDVLHACRTMLARSPRNKA